MSAPKSEINKVEILELATDVIAAYVGNHTVPLEDLPGLVHSVYQVMEDTLNSEAVAKAEKPVPAVPLDQSFSDTYIICLEDGKKYKSLKRHLRTSHGMTPKAYVQKWGLPLDYPMVAPSYSQQRSSLAKRTGLGKA